MVDETLSKIGNDPFVVATVSTQVGSNFIANSIIVSRHATEGAAKREAQKLHNSLDNQLSDREDFGNGAVIGEAVIVHNGYQVL